MDVLSSKIFWENFCTKQTCWIAAFAFPYPQTERPHLHIDYMINTRAFCSLLIFWREDGQPINKLPTFHPICRRGCFFHSSPNPPTLTQTPSTPNCHTVVASSDRIRTDSYSKFLCLSLSHPQPSAAPTATPTFLCSVLFYKKYNPIDPKPDGKRWSVNSSVFNNRCPVLGGDGGAGGGGVRGEF